MVALWWRGSRLSGDPRSAPTTCSDYSRDFALAVVEAKAAYKNAADGLQQAKEYAQILGLKFAYGTNGQSIIEHDFLTGEDHELDGFPWPTELWSRLRAKEGISEEVAARLLTPYEGFRA
jgi:type I restriction enzyme R subunit